MKKYHYLSDQLFIFSILYLCKVLFYLSSPCKLMSVAYKLLYPSQMFHILLPLLQSPNIDSILPTCLFLYNSVMLFQHPTVIQEKCVYLFLSKSLSNFHLVDLPFLKSPLYFTILNFQDFQKPRSEKNTIYKYK